jgi:hypothetical protein
MSKSKKDIYRIAIFFLLYKDKKEKGKPKPTKAKVWMPFPFAINSFLPCPHRIVQ